MVSNWYASCLRFFTALGEERAIDIVGVPVVTRSDNRVFEEVFLGYRILERDGIYIAIPLDWAHGRGETIVASDLPTLRKEIRRWWYQVDF